MNLIQKHILADLTRDRRLSPDEQIAVHAVIREVVRLRREIKDLARKAGGLVAELDQRREIGE